MQTLNKFNFDFNAWRCYIMQKYSKKVKIFQGNCPGRDISRHFVPIIIFYGLLYIRNTFYALYLKFRKNNYGVVINWRGALVLAYVHLTTYCIKKTERWDKYDKSITFLLQVTDK